MFEDMMFADFICTNKTDDQNELLDNMIKQGFHPCFVVNKGPLFEQAKLNFPNVVLLVSPLKLKKTYYA